MHAKSFRKQLQHASLVVDLTDTFTSRYLSLFAKAPTARVQKNSLRKWVFVRTGINQLENVHFVDKTFEALATHHVKPDSLGIDFFVRNEDEIDPSWIPATHQKSYAVFALSAPYATRQLPMDRMIDLCAKINKPLVVLGDSGDRETANELASFFDTKGIEEKLKSMGKKTVILNLVDKLSISQTASVIRRSSFVFGHDHWYIHMAAAFRKPVFTFWGNTVPLFGSYPYKTKFWIFENKAIDCRPCSTTGYQKCPRGHFKCMNDLQFDFYLD